MSSFLFYKYFVEQGYKGSQYGRWCITFKGAIRESKKYCESRIYYKDVVIYKRKKWRKLNIKYK